MVTARVMYLKSRTSDDLGVSSGLSSRFVDDDVCRASGIRTGDSWGRDMDGVVAMSESEMSSLGCLGFLCDFFGVRVCDNGVSLSCSKYSTVLLDFGLFFDFVFAGEIVVLSLRGLPRGLLGDVVSTWLDGGAFPTGCDC